MFPLDDTIVAVASAPGGAARGIVRLSGPSAAQLVTAVFAPAVRIDLLQIRSATRIECLAAAIGRQVPASLFLWPTARSFTRQPVAEIHTFGSTSILEAIVQALCANGARLAQPGEFTLRAFLAGRIDLTQAEAVLGVIDAADERQLKTALAQLAGGFSQPLLKLRSDLLDLLADLEAGLDFAEEHIQFVADDEVLRRVSTAAAELERLSEQLENRGTAGRLPRVVLVGLPNVGKSSLFNALVGDGAAIVSPQAGTTRDYLSAAIDSDGLEVELVDTAGVFQTNKSQLHSIDSAAQSVAVQQHVEADLMLVCSDEDSAASFSVTEERRLLVLTKSDLASGTKVNSPHEIRTSAKTGLGIREVQIAIRQKLESQRSGTEVVAATAVRVRESLHGARASLQSVAQLVAAGAGEELAAAELRGALAELGTVVGAIYTDDLLDRIFSRFCIGK